MTAISHAGYIATRHARALLRQPWYILASLTQPLIWLLLFGQLFEQVTDLPGFPTDSYIAYLTPGIIIMTAMFANSWNGMGLLDDIDSGVLDRMLTSPVKRSAILNGVNIQQVIALAVQASILFGLALLLGASFEGGVAGFMVLLGIGILLGAGFGGISMATALSVRQRESVIGMNQLLVLPGIFLSTAFLPGNLLPGWIETVSRFNPVDWAAVAAQEALLHSEPDWGTVVWRVGLLAVFSIAATLLGILSFRSYQRSI
jgi:ABC-2 type transport system permease protein